MARVFIWVGPASGLRRTLEPISSTSPGVGGFWIKATGALNWAVKEREIFGFDTERNGFSPDGFTNYEEREKEFLPKLGTNEYFYMWRLFASVCSRWLRNQAE